MTEPIPESIGRLTVVMPVYNEENTIKDIVARVLARPEVGELIIVNDASTDSTWEKLQEIANEGKKIKLFSQSINQGKGAALARAFPEATKDFVLIQDADYEYSPEEYPIIMEPFIKNNADVVYGSRFMGTPGIVRYFAHEMGNKFLTFLSNLFTDIHLSDMETCYKGFKREVIQNLILGSNRFGIEVEMTAKLARSRCLTIWQVPITYNPRRYKEGKKIGWRDGVAALFHILHYNVFNSDKKSFVKPWSEILKDKE